MLWLVQVDRYRDATDLVVIDDGIHSLAIGAVVAPEFVQSGWNGGGLENCRLDLDATKAQSAIIEADRNILAVQRPREGRNFSFADFKLARLDQAPCRKVIDRNFTIVFDGNDDRVVLVHEFCKNVACRSFQLCLALGDDMTAGE
ncbi:MAG: hypothetical protein WA156_01795 [Methylocystis silviterrae]